MLLCSSCTIANQMQIFKMCGQAILNKFYSTWLGYFLSYCCAQKLLLVTVSV